ncbi:MAG: hypothetical protein V1838_02985 [Patescibacteria group bacterium]
MYQLQHRGQENCGIVPGRGSKLAEPIKISGLVDQLFTKEVINWIKKFRPTAGIGHTRYATAGGINPLFAQPHLIKVGIMPVAAAFNGDLPCISQQRLWLEKQGVVLKSGTDKKGQLVSPNDGEVILLKIGVLAGNSKRDIISGIRKLMQTTPGAYSGVLLAGGKLYAFRDPWGFRPLCYGWKEDVRVIASESCVFSSNDPGVEDEIRPGELIIFGGDVEIERHQLVEPKEPTQLCPFEHIYFQRPDSRLFGISETENFAIRYEFGRALAREHPVSDAIVVAVPDSGTPAAKGYARECDLEDKVLFTVNRFMPKGVARTFQIAGQESREELVRRKYSIHRSLLASLIYKLSIDVIRGPVRLVLVDDSIVRLTTLSTLIKIIRETWQSLGGKLADLEIIVRIPSPRIIGPCYYGIDIHTYRELIAASNDNRQIAQKLGQCVSSVEYLSLADLNSVLNRFAADYGYADGFCNACFTNKYPTVIESCEEK